MLGLKKIKFLGPLSNIGLIVNNLAILITKLFFIAKVS